MDDFIGRRNLIAPETLRELTRRSDWKGAIQTLGHFGAIAVTGTGLWITWGSWWAAPWFIVHGMLVNFLFAAQHECNHYTAHHTFPAVPFHRLPELHAELERRLGYSPPTVGYVEFQRRFIAALTRGPEPVEGVNEVAPVIRRAA